MDSFELIVSPIVANEVVLENYDEIRARVEKKATEYGNNYYSEENRDLAKKDRAKLNKAKKAISDFRIAKKKEYLEYFNGFERQTKDLEDLIDKAVLRIDAQDKAFEDKRKAEKQKAIEELFASMGFQNFVTLEKIQDPKWLNASVSMKSIEDQMRSKMYEIGDDVLTLHNLLEFGFEATEVYKQTLDINKAIKEAQRMSEIAKAKAEAETRRKAEEESRKAAEEARRKAEEERKTQEKAAEEQRAAMAMAMTPPVQDSQPEPQKMVVKFEVELTTEDATALREFFQSRNITFRAIK